MCYVVDMITGKPWVEYLSEPELWNTTYDILHILKEIQVIIGIDVACIYSLLVVHLHTLFIKLLYVTEVSSII